MVDSWYALPKHVSDHPDKFEACIWLTIINGALILVTVCVNSLFNALFCKSSIVKKIAPSNSQNSSKFARCFVKMFYVYWYNLLNWNNALNIGFETFENAATSSVTCSWSLTDVFGSSSHMSCGHWCQHWRYATWWDWSFSYFGGCIWSYVQLSEPIHWFRDTVNPITLSCLGPGQLEDGCQSSQRRKAPR